MSFTQSKTIDILSKKYIWDKSATDVEREYFEESYYSRKEVLLTDIWLQSDEIPNTAATVSGVVTSITATLSYVAGSRGSYVNTSLADAIPYYWGDGVSYQYRVFRNDGVTDVNSGEAEWFFDNNSGVLTFTSATNSGTGLVHNSSGIIIASASAPPVMRVWKYVGKKGVVPDLGSGLTYSGGVLSVSTTPYVEYKALLSQTGTSAPTANILSNTLTGTWSYVSTGIYYFTSTGNFSNIAKVEVYIPGVTILGYPMTNNLFHLKSAARLDNDRIEVRTALLTNYYADRYVTFDTLGGSPSDILKDDVLSYAPITIRVWS
jgi:hypothetical protein